MLADLLLHELEAFDPAPEVLVSRLLKPALYGPRRLRLIRPPDGGNLGAEFVHLLRHARLEAGQRSREVRGGIEPLKGLEGLIAPFGSCFVVLVDTVLGHAGHGLPKGVDECVPDRLDVNTDGIVARDDKLCVPLVSQVLDISQVIRESGIEVVDGLVRSRLDDGSPVLVEGLYAITVGAGELGEGGDAAGAQEVVALLLELDDLVKKDVSLRPDIIEFLAKLLQCLASDALELIVEDGPVDVQVRGGFEFGPGVVASGVYVRKEHVAGDELEQGESVTRQGEGRLVDNEGI
ncbi:hypothetical protein BC936DRAFT_145369 [Jimgerdemannia flammicorona]|uniref:Uncharacterized protein n=2 Tax=Jimgerdemannia flammicorona TaxID=994334 RepID=A0A433DAB3_9FUNG|nr:hypothetical protein BC936DRAFT_145369 [Jimgerdemannia flammicorona]RUS32412.1 hypothetical protein BC938DRAFT_475455 [Jimgerdemannia flammicorona]